MNQNKFEAGVTYHIFNRGNNKENIFLETDNYIYFLGLVEKYLLPICDIYAYCLLKNHFHIVLRIKDIENLPENIINKLHLPFSNLFNSYSKSINKKYNRTGSLFQEHLKRKKVETEEYLIQLIAYVHLNPSNHNLIDDFKKYKFSSYNAYITTKKSKISKEFIFSLIDFDNFEYWHNEKYLMNKINEEVLKGMEM